MATLNTSTEGPAITKSYRTVVESPLPSGPAASSPTYGQWVVYSVAAPLASAFQNDSGKESILKVHRTGEGELEDLVDEFSEGRIQFAFVKVKDPNTKLAKSVLIAWCGEGVPERTKGYFTSHVNAVANLLHGYHVQITARTDNDLTPEGIIRKVADSSGSKYSGETSVSSAGGAPPPVASKPVFMPSKVGGGGGSGFNPLGSRSRQAPQTPTNVDEDGWGEDAPQVTRSQLEKVQSSYQPTKVNMAELTSQKEPSRYTPSAPSSTPSDVVKGGYQPIGKVDINAIKREAQSSGKAQDERPTAVKGSYEPVGKVDIAAIRAKAQPPPDNSVAAKPTSPDQEDKPIADRWVSTSGDRLTSMPKPKVSGKFGANTSSFTGTKAPVPGGFESKPVPSSAAPIGAVGKNFADEGGKTPAQIWAEKKGRTRGFSGAADTAAPVQSQTSGGGQWESGYSGKKWAPVSTTRTGQSAASAGDDIAREDRNEPSSPSGHVSSIRDRFKDTAPMGAATDVSREAPPPPMDLSSKPNAGAGQGIPGEESNRMPTPPAQPPRSPTPPTPEAETSGSPIRVAMPVARGQETAMEAPDERREPSPLPTNSMRQAVPDAQDMKEEADEQRDDPARATAIAAAGTTFGAQAVEHANAEETVGGKRAIAQYDYEKQEENELELIDGQMVINIDMVDPDWWMGENEKGERGLFPANYVELVEDEDAAPAPPAPPQPARTDAAAPKGKTATAQYDYEAQEDNELSFPDGAKITQVEFPDEDWWFGSYGGREGLFPANYVELDS